MKLATMINFTHSVRISESLPSSKAPVRMINNSLTIASVATIILSNVFILGLPFWNPALAAINRNPPFSLIFMPRLGIIGAGIGWTTAQTVACVFTMPKLARIWFYRRNNHMKSTGQL